HLEAGAYESWKVARVAGAMRQHGIESPLSPLRRGRPAARRRATFTARRAGSKFLFGYSAANSHRLVNLEECHVIVPEIARSLPHLRELAIAAGASERQIRLAVTATDTGLDIELPDLARLLEKRRQNLV